MEPSPSPHLSTFLLLSLLMWNSQRGWGGCAWWTLTSFLHLLSLSSAQDSSGPKVEYFPPLSAWPDPALVSQVLVTPELLQFGFFRADKGSSISWFFFGGRGRAQQSEREGYYESDILWLSHHHNWTCDPTERPWVTVCGSPSLYLHHLRAKKE